MPVLSTIKSKTKYSIVCSSYQPAWNKALEYLDNLPPKRQEAFDRLDPNQQAIFKTNVDASEIVRVLQAIGESSGSISRLVVFSEKVVQPFWQFNNALDVIVQVNAGIGSPLWAPIKIILQACHHFVLLWKGDICADATRCRLSFRPRMAMQRSTRC